MGKGSSHLRVIALTLAGTLCAAAQAAAEDTIEIVGRIAHRPRR